MDLSYQERSVLGSLAATLAVFGIYFVKVAGLASEGQLEVGRVLWLMIGAVIVLIIIEIVYHILISARSGQPPLDERDKLVAARAGRNSGLVLGAGAVVTIVAILVSELSGGATHSPMGLSPIMIAQVILLLLVIAQAVQFLSQLYYYRRGF